jgi:hypothetical protein
MLYCGEMNFVSEKSSREIILFYDKHDGSTCRRESLKIFRVFCTLLTPPVSLLTLLAAAFPKSLSMIVSLCISRRHK